MLDYLIFYLYVVVSYTVAAPAIQEYSQGFSPFRGQAGQSSWVTKGNFAHVVDAKPISTGSVLIPINIFMLGFDGSGVEGVNISTDVLHHWLEHLDHTQLQALIDTTPHGLHNPDVDAVDVRYHYDLRLIETSPLVHRALERTLANNFREGYAKDIMKRKVQLDSTAVTDLFDDLVNTLDLPGYNLFLYASSAERWLPFFFDYTYGYRSTLSTKELSELRLKDNGKYLTNMLKYLDPNTFQALDLPPYRGLNVDQTNQIHHGLGSGVHGNSPNNPRSRDILKKDYRVESGAWAQRRLAEASLPGPVAADVFLEDLAARAPQTVRELLGKPHGQADCLLDSWMGSQRSLFIDLSAGPFEWGPTIHDEGTKTSNSHPSMAGFASRALAHRLNNMDMDFLKPDPNPRPRPSAADNDEEEASIPPQPLPTSPEQSVAFVQTLLKDYISRHCWPQNGDVEPIEDWVTQDMPLEQQHTCTDAIGALAQLSTRVAAQDLTHLNAFSFLQDDSKHGQAQAADLETSDFLAHVSAALSRAVRRVITPPVADTHLTTGYARKVNFQVIVLSNHHSYDPLGKNKGLLGLFNPLDRVHIYTYLNPTITYFLDCFIYMMTLLHM